MGVLLLAIAGAVGVFLALRNRGAAAAAPPPPSSAVTSDDLLALFSALRAPAGPDQLISAAPAPEAPPPPPAPAPSSFASIAPVVTVNKTGLLPTVKISTSNLIAGAKALAAQSTPVKPSSSGVGTKIVKAAAAPLIVPQVKAAKAIGSKIKSLF